MSTREQAIEFLKQHHDPERECGWIVDAILALPDPEVELELDDEHDCDCRVCEEARTELARLRPVVEAAREVREAALRGLTTKPLSMRDPIDKLNAALLAALDGER